MKFAAVNVSVVSSVPLTAIAARVGVSFTPVRLITTFVVAVPSLTDTAYVSVALALNALIAAAFGVNA